MTFKQCALYIFYLSDSNWHKTYPTIKIYKFRKKPFCVSGPFINNFSISIPHFIEKYFLNKLQRHLFYATERIFSTLMGHPKGERERERRVVSKSGLEFHFLLSAKCCLRRRRRRLRHRMLTPSCRFWSSKKRERKKIINLGKKEKGHLKKANAKAQSKDNLKFGFGCLLFIDSDLSWHHTVAYWDCLVQVFPQISFNFTAPDKWN